MLNTETYTVEEIARMLGIGRASAYRLVKDEPPFPILHIGRLIRVPKAGFESWLSPKKIKPSNTKSKRTNQLDVGKGTVLKLNSSTLKTENDSSNASCIFEEECKMSNTAKAEDIGVYKRCDSDTYYFKVSFKHPETGEKIRVSHGEAYQTQEAAIRAKKVAEAQIVLHGAPDFYYSSQAKNDDYILRPTMPLEEYMLYWFENVHAPEVCEGTAIGDWPDLKNHIIPALGEVPLNKLTTKKVKEMCDTMRLPKEYDGKGLKYGGVSRIVTTLKNALNHAKEQGLIASNPAKRVSIIPDEEAFEPTLLDKEQREKLLSVVDNYSNGIGIAIQLLSGLRSAEARGLKYSDIDFEHGTLTIKRQVVKTNVTGKTQYVLVSKLKQDSKSKRPKIRVPVPIQPRLIEMLEKRKTMLKETMGNNYHDGLFVLCDKHGNLLKPRPYYDTLKAMLKRTELPNMRNHDLRHTFATVCAEAGMPEKVLANILGHATTEMIQRYYVGNISGNDIARNIIDRL